MTKPLMTTIHIDHHRALSLLQRVVANFGPGYVYERDADAENYGTFTCSYIRDGQPSCLVANALSLAGVSPVELLRMDNAQIQFNGPETSIERIELPARLTLTTEARRVFGAAQEYQDLQGTWGDALGLAQTAFNEIEDWSNV